MNTTIYYATMKETKEVNAKRGCIKESIADDCFKHGVKKS